MLAMARARPFASQAVETRATEALPPRRHRAQHVQVRAALRRIKELDESLRHKSFEQVMLSRASQPEAWERRERERLHKRAKAVERQLRKERKDHARRCAHLHFCGRRTTSPAELHRWVQRQMPCRRRVAAAVSALDALRESPLDPSAAQHPLLGRVPRLDDSEAALVATLLATDTHPDQEPNPFDPHSVPPEDVLDPPAAATDVEPVASGEASRLSVADAGLQSDETAGRVALGATSLPAPVLDAAQHMTAASDSFDVPPQTSESMSKGSGAPSLVARSLADIDRELLGFALDHSWDGNASLIASGAPRSARVSAVRSSVAGTLRGLSHSVTGSVAAEASSVWLRSDGRGAEERRTRSESGAQASTGGVSRASAVSRHTTIDYLRPMREARELAAMCALTSSLVPHVFSSHYCSVCGCCLLSFPFVQVLGGCCPELLLLRSLAPHIGGVSQRVQSVCGAV